MRGGTVLGFMIGLVVGLAIAVVVALFVTRAPVPFVNKAGRAPDRVLEPRTPADAPDPNKPLYSKNQPVPVPEQRPAEAPQDRGSILERLFGRQPEPEPQGQGGGAPIVAARPAAPPPAPAAAVKGAPPAGDASSTSDRPGDAADRAAGYLLQAGAFRGREDADGMRGRLALLGFEARVLSAEVNGQPMYRVRVGPFAQLDDMNNARARLAENGIEASVVRQR
ncbi:MAG TPA: SPOR domain-containing protein [Quisquiliibacterium sp.]|nr:SPOR domain-containing protein [Quisquiliibacterium sp.]